MADNQKKTRKKVSSTFGEDAQQSTPHDTTAGIPAEVPETPERNQWNYWSSPSSATSASSASDYFPSGSSYPWSDLTMDEKWPSSDYISFLKNSETKEESKLKFDDKELEKIESFTTKEECHRYRLGKNKSLALYDSLLILFDNILKILHVVMLSSLPLLLLNNIASPTNNFDIYLIILIYSIMISAVIVSLVLRWIFKNEWMIREQYIIAVNKKEEEIVSKK
jgi:hypothetical protein